MKLFLLIAFSHLLSFLTMEAHFLPKQSDYFEGNKILTAEGYLLKPPEFNKEDLIPSDGFQICFSKQAKNTIGYQSKETLCEMLRNVSRICSGQKGNENTLTGGTMRRNEVEDVIFHLVYMWSYC